MRDPAVLAVFALRVTAAEFAAGEGGAPIVRLYWAARGPRRRG